ncbi:hypothetical protein V8F20_011031 [Naviculisporaceae sp. PSN 640]
MGQFYQTIPPNIYEWILQQKIFWVGTAPLSGSGHVNISPKGGLYFGLLNDHTFWYIDLSGSGNETISHLYEPGNGRITIMFSAFDGSPRIVRLWGHGKVLENDTAEFHDFVKKHDVKTIPGSRSIIVVDVHQVGSSCGYSVPKFDFKSFRTTLNEWNAKKAKEFEEGKTEQSFPRYWAYKNAESVDGLPGLELGRRTAKEEGIAPIKKMVGMPDRGYKSASAMRFSLWHLFLVALISVLATVSFIGTLPFLGARLLVSLPA